MTKRPMTKTQRIALAFMAGCENGETCGYDLKRNNFGNAATLDQLALRGYATRVGSGHMAFPATARFRITNSGRAALKEGGDA